MTPIPPKVWTIVCGDFDLPPDEEFDAMQASRLPPVAAGWPFSTCHFVDHYADGREVPHYFIRSGEGKWLEIIDQD